MNKLRVALVSSAIALACVPVARADEGRTVDPARAEFQVACPWGDLAWGVPSPSANDPAPARTRAEVIAELAAARKAGDLVLGEAGMTLREKNPSAYASTSPRRVATSGTRSTAQ